MKHLFVIVFLLTLCFHAQKTTTTIMPLDITKTRPDYKYNWMNYLLGYTYKSYNISTNPTVPTFICDDIASYVQTFSGVQPPQTQNSIVRVYFKDAPHTGAYREGFKSVLPVISSIVYSISPTNYLDPDIDIEANTRYILFYSSPEVEVYNEKETAWLSIESSLTEEQIFSKAVPILEHNDLPVNINNYKFSFNDHRELIKNVEFWKSTWIVQTADENKEINRIALKFSRCSGRLIELWFFPSQATIQKWYEHQNSGKVQ